MTLVHWFLKNSTNFGNCSVGTRIYIPSTGKMKQTKKRKRKLLIHSFKEMCSFLLLFLEMSETKVLKFGRFDGRTYTSMIRTDAFKNMSLFDE